MDGVLVETIEAGLIDDIDGGLLGIGDGDRRVGCGHLSIGLHAEHRAEMDALLCIACSVARHRQLAGDGLHLMRHLGRQGDAAVDVTLHLDGDELIRVRGEVLPLDGLPVAHVPIFNNSRVEVEAAMVATDFAEPEVLDVQCA